MSLHAELKKAKTEEDVKDAYVRALGLKKYSKNLVDIQTKEIWFEAKEAGQCREWRNRWWGLGLARIPEEYRKSQNTRLAPANS